MSAIETAVKGSQRLEQLLEARFGAEGRGLHEKVSSIETQLPGDLVRRLRWIATLRNQAVHEGAEIDDVTRFQAAVDESLEKLGAIPPGRKVTAALASLTADRPGRRRMFGPWIKVRVFLVLIIGGVVAYQLYGRRLSRAPLQAPATPVNVSMNISDPGQAPPSGAARRPLGANLAELARQATANQAAAEKDVEDNVWATLATNTRITLGAPDLKDNGDGTHDLRVAVGFAVDLPRIREALQRHFTVEVGDIDFTDHMGSKAPGISVQRYSNQGDRQRQPYTWDLFRQITAKQARIRVTAGKHFGWLTIATGRKCFVFCGDRGQDQFQIHTDNRARPEVSIFDSERDGNPVLIRKIPTSALKTIGDLSALVVIEKPVSAAARPRRTPR